MAAALTVSSLEAAAIDPAGVSFALVVAAVKLFHWLSIAKVDAFPCFLRRHSPMDYFYRSSWGGAHPAHAHRKIRQ